MKTPICYNGRTYQLDEDDILYHCPTCHKVEVRKAKAVWSLKACRDCTKIKEDKCRADYKRRMYA